MKKMILIFAILLLVFSGCTQEEKPKETLPATTLPAVTLPPETAAPAATLPPATQPPVTTQPPTTAAPMTAPPSTTAPPAKPLEIYDVVATEDSNLNIYVTGKVKNNLNTYQFDVRVIETLYDEYGRVIKTEQSVPVEKLAPGESYDFKITSTIRKSNVKSYTLEAVSTSITPATTTPPPLAKELATADVIEGINPNAQLTLRGKVKNTGTKTYFQVYVEVTLYDIYGNFLKTEKTAPFDKMSPGETKDFSFTSTILREKIGRYTYEAKSESSSA